MAERKPLVLGDDGNIQQLQGVDTLDGFPVLTASRALVSDTSGKVSVSSASLTEVGYLGGVTSAIQTQFTGKAPIASPTFTGTVVLPSTTSIGNITNTELGYLDGVTSAIQLFLFLHVNDTDKMLVEMNMNLKHSTETLQELKSYFRGEKG